MTDHRFARPSRRQFVRGSVLGALGLAGAALIGCSDNADEETATATTAATEAPPAATEAATEAPTEAPTQAPAATEAPPLVELFALSNSSPHISVIDGATIVAKPAFIRRAPRPPGGVRSSQVRRFQS